jgi:DNA-binding SARP family transcriptional activator
LALLALRGRQSRVHVAATLWPEVDDELAGGRLRSLLWRMHRSGLDPFELTDGFMALRAEIDVDACALRQVAVHLLDELVLSGPPPSLEAALRVLDCPELLLGWYDDWVLAERDSLNDLRVHALEALVDRFIDVGRPREALRAARVAVRADRFRESAHRAAIRALVAEGNPASAVRQYERYCAFVRTELGIDQPTHEMAAAIHAISAPTAI